MIREKLGKILSSKVFFITFSILVAFALWMYVEISENQLQSHTVRDVPVVQLKTEVLSDRGLMITSLSPENVTLTFECPRSVAARLTSATLSVAIDLTNVTTRGNTTLPFDIVYPSNVDPDTFSENTRSVNRISLYVDRLESRSIPVEVVYRGGVADGYLQDPLEYSPQTITVVGPAEAVSEARRARVVIERENLVSTYTDDLPLTIIGEDGEVLSDTVRDQLTPSDDLIWVNVPIRVLKEVALTAELNYRSGATSENTVVTITPQTVTIAGEPEDIRDLNSINLGTIDTARFEHSDTDAFVIVLPNNVTPISGESEAFVRVEVLGLEIKYISVPNTNIHVVNVPPGYTPVIGSQSADVRIRGRAEDMESLTEANIRVLVSVPDGGMRGMQRVLARVVIDGIDADIGAIGNNYVTFALIQIEDNPLDDS